MVLVEEGLSHNYGTSRHNYALCWLIDAPLVEQGTDLHGDGDDGGDVGLFLLSSIGTGHQRSNPYRAHVVKLTLDATSIDSSGFGSILNCTVGFWVMESEHTQSSPSSPPLALRFFPE